MAKYSSKPTVAHRSAEDLYNRFEDLSYFEEKLKQLPPEQLAKVGDVSFGKDYIAINTPQVGQLKFEVIERVKPTKVVFGSPGSPIPLTMEIDFKPLSDDSSEVSAAIDVELPAMLSSFVGPKLQEAADKFGEMISNLSK